MLSNLEGELVVIEDENCVVEIAVEMVCDGKGNPVLPEIGAKAEDGVAGVDEGIKETELGLETGCVAENVEIVLRPLLAMSGRRDRAHLVEAESLSVRLERTVIVVLCRLDEGKDVPADGRLKIQDHALLHELDALVAPADVGEEEAFHADGFWGRVSGEGKSGKNTPP